MRGSGALLLVWGIVALALASGRAAWAEPPAGGAGPARDETAQALRVVPHLDGSDEELQGLWTMVQER